MVGVATLVSSGGYVGRRQPPPHALRNRNEPRNRNRNHHSRKKRKKAKKGNTRETSHIVILFFVLFRFFRLNRLLLPPGSCPENKMFRLCSTEQAVCSVPVRAYLRVTGHESRDTGIIRRLRRLTPIARQCGDRASPSRQQQNNSTFQDAPPLEPQPKVNI